jgi:hypothetical protein
MLQTSLASKIVRRALLVSGVLFVLTLLGVGILYLLAYTQIARPSAVQYGVSFNTLYAHELGLDWLQTYTAILDELEVRHLRLAGHWPMVQPEEGVWNFEELDTQMRMAEERGVSVILAVGRRLPRWPECHVPEWAKAHSWEEQKELVRTYLHIMVERYRDSSALLYFQVENEPFLEVFAQEHCGELDTAFLDEEIALVRTLDPSHPILVTDSGNLGLWSGAYKRGDVFGTSVYVYLWNEATGPITSILPPHGYMLKRTLMRILYGDKPSILIELSAEPWLDRPVPDVSLAQQFERMNPERFDSILEYAQKTRFDTQYLWGAEWWYWLKTQQDSPEMWERAKVLYGADAVQ